MSLYSFAKKIVKSLRKRELIPIIKAMPSDSLLNNKTVLITGGTGGIGSAVAELFVRGGVKVILSGRSEEKLESAKKKLNSISAESCEVLPIDMKDISSFPQKVKEASKIFGSFDVLVHCSGVHTENVDFWTMTESEFDRVMNINLKGCYFMCQAVGKYFCDSKIKGKIVLISSSRGSEPAWSPYGISKWGMNGMVKGLAQIFSKHGITVNAVAPGSTATSLLGYKNGESISSEENAAGRMIMPEEVSNLVSLLASDAGNMINGEVIHISAGRGVFDIR